MKKIFWMILAVTMIFFAGCVFVQPYTGAPGEVRGKGKLISATDSGFSILWLSSPTVDAIKYLKPQCQGGIIQGVRVSSSNRMFLIGALYKQEAWGYCLKEERRIHKGSSGRACKNDEECIQVCKTNGFTNGLCSEGKKCLCK